MATPELRRRRSIRAAARTARAALSSALRRTERGTVATMVALLLIPMMGMLALTVDIGYAYGQRRLAQNVADSAAVNGAVVVGKRITAPSEIWVKDTDVIDAINVVANRSSGGYAFGSGLQAEYVRRESDGSVTKVGDVGTGVLCTSNGTTGCIPSNATGVRVYSVTTFNTFFGVVLAKTSLAAGARATAINATVTRMAIAPYALWTGENGPDGDGDGITRQIQGGITPPDYLCRDGSGNPVVLTINGNTIDAPAGSFSSASGKAYNYACTGSTSNGIAPGTMFTIRSAPNFATPNVSNGNPNWQVSSSSFKGFIRVDSADGLVGAGDYVSDGGVAGGTEDSGMQIIDNCYRTYCTLIMPIVAYGTNGPSNGQPALLVSGFAAVKVNDRTVTINTQNPTTAQTSYDWKAMVVNAPITCCALGYSWDVTPGSTTLLYVRLYQ